MRRAFLIDERWIDSVLNERGLVLHSFVHNGVKLVVGHHLEETGRQFFSCQEVFIPLENLANPLLPREICTEVRRFCSCNL